MRALLPLSLFPSAPLPYRFSSFFRLVGRLPGRPLVQDKRDNVAWQAEAGPDEDGLGKEVSRIETRPDQQCSAVCLTLTNLQQEHVRLVHGDAPVPPRAAAAAGAAGAADRRTAPVL